MPNSLGLNKSPQETKVCIAMSGGVDSSVAAWLLQKEGYQVFGLTMDLLQPPYAPPVSSISDAAVIADQLGIEHHFIDLRQEFSELVVKYFSDEYIAGKTPSPCIMCNKHIKLGLLAEKARDFGADILVTGHYAKTIAAPHGIELHRGSDPVRDQSYFLFAVAKENLQMLRCPLSGYSKDQTRKIAEEAGLKTAQKTDSQDICFVSGGKYAELIRSLRPELQEKPGDIVTTDGKILGRHKGLINYTVGQRRGLGIGGGDILYVLALDTVKNRVIVGSKPQLAQKYVFIKNINWLAEERPFRMELGVKLRSRQEIVPASVFFSENADTARIELKDEFFGIAPGQGCCFYNNTRVMGGGFICKDNPEF